ncbi:hypothetical protein [Paraglaciecola sp. L3A3]|uniref:hypothetical protein n=1 Tax=Paraglaciecola sp. L3A3 TaxID=2686358 RepID=UPI00131B724D|nr:hypothetical protein [Paraglaciecola sp. L3A3]
MKKIICLVAIMSAAFVAQAKESSEGTSLQGYLKWKKNKAEKQGDSFNEKYITKQFKEMDTDGNGFVSKKEVKTYWDKKYPK